VRFDRRAGNVDNAERDELRNDIRCRGQPERRCCQRSQRQKVADDAMPWSILVVAVTTLPAILISPVVVTSDMVVVLAASESLRVIPVCVIPVRVIPVRVIPVRVDMVTE